MTSPRPGGAGVAPPSLMQLAQRLLHELPGLLSDRIELLSLELERAKGALGRIVILIVAAAVLGVTAWLAAWAVVFLALLALGLPPLAALLIILVINALTAWWALQRARKLSGVVSLPATRRHLTLAPNAAPPSKDADDHVQP